MLNRWWNNSGLRFFYNRSRESNEIGNITWLNPSGPFFAIKSYRQEKRGKQMATVSPVCITCLFRHTQQHGNWVHCIVSLYSIYTCAMVTLWRKVGFRQAIMVKAKVTSASSSSRPLFFVSLRTGYMQIRTLYFCISCTLKQFYTVDVMAGTSSLLRTVYIALWQGTILVYALATSMSSI